VYRAKSYTSVFLAGMFLFVPSDTFLWDVSFSHKTHCKKNEVRNVILPMDSGYTQA